MGCSRILAIGDIHAPWIHKPTFTNILRITQALQPTVIVQVGDSYDFFSFSRFPHNPKVILPEEELQQGREVMEEVWRLLQKYAPKAKCYQLMGNHCIRPIKMATEKAPDLSSIVGSYIKNLLTFDNVTTIYDSTQELVIEDIVFMHGFRSKLGDHCIYNQMKTVCGHSHRGGTFFHPTINNKQIWELNCGYIADPSASEALRYNPQRYVKWTRGVGIIDSYGCRFIPL
jgi:hypothetical protein